MSQATASNARAADAVSVHSGDGDLREVLPPVEEPLPRSREVTPLGPRGTAWPGRFGRSGACAGREVGPGGERPARAAEHDDAHAHVTLELVGDGCEAGEHVAVEGVQLVRAIEGHPHDRSVPFRSDTHRS